MIETLANYIELQKIDGERHAIEQQLALYPPKLAAIEKHGRQLKDALARLDAEKRAGELEQRKIEKDMASIEEKIKKYQHQRDMVRTAKEGEALEHEIVSLSGQVSELEDKALGFMARADELTQEVAAAKAELEKFIQQAKTERGRIEEQIKSKKEALDILNADREQFRSKLDASQTEDYEIVATKYPGKVVVSVYGESCGGCHTQLMPKVLVELRSGNKSVRCPHCQRFLVEKLEA
jgi:uncharacterized protein